MMSNTGSAVASAVAGMPIDGNVIVDLAEVRAARERTAIAAAAALVPVKAEDLFEGIRQQASMVGAAAELMMSGMNRLIDELDILMNDVRVAKEFCTASAVLNPTDTESRL